MRKRIIGIGMCLIMLLGLTGCSLKIGNAFTEDGKMHVVTTIFAAYDFSKQVGGDYAETILLLKPGSESHSYEPSPADIIAIEQCDVFICTGGENDAWVETILDAIENSDMRIIRMTECVSKMYTEEEKEGMQSEGGFFAREENEEDEEEVEWDEHVWMDADNAIAICRNIAEIFAETDESHRDSFLKNCENYTAQLGEIDSEIKDIVSSAPRKELIFADRFPARYFTERYGLEYYAAFPGCSENAEASAATVSFLIDKVREDDIKVVLKIELSAGKLSAVVAEETGSETETFYTGHNVTAEDFEAGLSFADMLRKDAEVLKKALY